MIPAPLLKAHQELDRAVDRCYRPDPFPSDRQRVEYLCTPSLPFGSAFGCPKAFGPASRRTRLRPLRTTHRPAGGGGQAKETEKSNERVKGSVLEL